MTSRVWILCCQVSARSRSFNGSRYAFTFRPPLHVFTNGFADILVEQLAEAHEALSNATKASNDHAEATRARAEAFAAEQADIDQRLKAITQSESSDEAVRRLEKSMERLQRLEISKGYVELLKEAEELRYGFIDSRKEECGY